MITVVIVVVELSMVLVVNGYVGTVNKLYDISCLMVL